MYLMAIFLYDAACTNCTTWAGRLRRMAGRRVRVKPLQDFSSDDPRLSQDELLLEAKLVLNDGRVFGGAEAIARAVGGPALLYYLPGVRQLADSYYSRVAANRCRIPEGNRGES